MNLKKSDIIEGFQKLGLQKGDTVLVHSSLSSFGYVEGGADAVIEALIDTTGTEGTVVVPTLTGKLTDSPKCPPYFDVNNTKCWTGIIPETFRHYKKAKRSLHPTHSVSAIGKNRDYLIENHEMTLSPCDKNSPYYKISRLNGKILLIGVDLESNTSIHSCEEIAKVPYHLQKEMTHAVVIDYEGNKITVNNYLHDWHKPPTDFTKFEDLFVKNDIMKFGKIGNSPIRIIDSKAMFDFAVDLLVKKPLFLLK